MQQRRHHMTRAVFSTLAFLCDGYLMFWRCNWCTILIINVMILLLGVWRMSWMMTSSGRKVRMASAFSSWTHSTPSCRQRSASSCRVWRCSVSTTDYTATPGNKWRRSRWRTSRRWVASLRPFLAVEPTRTTARVRYVIRYPTTRRPLRSALSWACFSCRGVRSVCVQSTCEVRKLDLLYLVLVLNLYLGTGFKYFYLRLKYLYLYLNLEYLIQVCWEQPSWVVW